MGRVVRDVAAAVLGPVLVLAGVGLAVAAVADSGSNVLVLYGLSLAVCGSWGTRTLYRGDSRRGALLILLPAAGLALAVPALYFGLAEALCDSGDCRDHPDLLIAVGVAAGPALVLVAVALAVQDKRRTATARK